MANFQKIGARSCVVKELSSRKDKVLLKDFLQTNHIQGNVRGLKAAFGLFHQGELVQILAFGPPRFNRNFQWELIRECSKKELQILGGTSKLFKAFREAYMPLSIVVYTSMKDKHLFETQAHYEKHMNFELYEDSKEGFEEFYSSIQWPRADNHGREYSLSSVRHIGPDRLLGTNFGFSEGTNDELMKKLSYERLSRKTIKPKVSAYIATENLSLAPGASGYLYRVDCSCGGVYLGMSERMDELSIDSYIGSGTLWTVHLKENPDHSQTKSIIHWSFDAESLRNQEEKLIFIGKKIYGNRLYNTKLSRQGIKCPECDQFGRHRKTCSKFVKPGSRTKACVQCSGQSGHHMKNCSLYKASIAKACEECGLTRHHSFECSKKILCDECGSGNRGAHRKSCSLYKSLERCPECNSSRRHKVDCSQFKTPKACDECGSRSHHKVSCSSYQVPIPCAECGGNYGNHTKICSRNTRIGCEFCGSLTAHKKSCPHYKRPAGCAECGAIAVHFKTCSSYKTSLPCAECGGISGKHRKLCTLRSSSKISGKRPYS